MRLPGVQDGEGGLVTRVLMWLSGRKYGRVLSPTRIYAYYPKILFTVGQVFSMIKKTNSIPPRLKGLVMHRAASLVGCHF